MTLIKTSLLNGIAVAIKMLTLLGLNKILAIYVGPSGYAALGQFQNSVQMITAVASGAINTGVVKYTAEYQHDVEKQHAVWRTAGTIALVGSVVVSICVICFNETLAGWFLQDKELGSVFTWFAATLVFFVFNTLLLAILNGKKEIRRYVTANIAGSLFSLAVTTVMATQLGLYGALVALAVYQSLTFFVTISLAYRTSWFKLRYLFGVIDKQSAKNLVKYTIMSLTSAACVPLSHILIRNHLGESLGWDAAGHWEAMWRLSGAYLMLVTTTLSVYYLPKLSELSNTLDIRKEIIQGYKLILPLAGICGVVVYIMRDFVILLLFTPEFLAMRDLFAWQMFGNTLKIGSWILAYLMIGKAMLRLFVSTEVIFSISFVILVCTLTDSQGIKAPVIAYAINYGVYWAVMALCIPYLLNKDAMPSKVVSKS